MDDTLAESLYIMRRRELYDQLFRGELPYEALPDDINVGIAGLCRITERRSTRSTDLQTYLGDLPFTINNILSSHDAAAHDADGAIFGFINEESKKLVSDIVIKIFTQWEVTASRNGLYQILQNNESESRWLVVETAAAVMKAAGMPESGLNIRSINRDRQLLTKLIYNWGPRFIAQWLDGTILKQWMDQEAMSEAEQAEWLEVFTPGTRKYFAYSNNNDPLRALAKAKNHLDSTLSLANIAEYLDWDQHDVALIFTSGVRKQIAILNPAHPQKALNTSEQSYAITPKLQLLSKFK